MILPISAIALRVNDLILDFVDLSSGCGSYQPLSGQCPARRLGKIDHAFDGASYICPAIEKLTWALFKAEHGALGHAAVVLLQEITQAKRSLPSNKHHIYPLPRHL